MDISTLFGILAAFALIAVNGYFVATEFALLRVRPTRINQLAAQGDKNASVAQKQLHHLNLSLAAAQIGITLAGLALGWIGEPALEHALEPLFMWAGGAVARDIGTGLAIIISLLFITALHTIFGEVLPKSIGITHSEKMLLFAARPFSLFARAFYPLIRALHWIERALMQALRLHSPIEETLVHSPEELERLATLMHTSDNNPVMAAQEQRPGNPRNRPGGLPVWTVIIALIVISGVGVFGGWLLGKNTSAANGVVPTPIPTQQAGFDQDAARVGVIAKFRPSVVQINVTTQDGKSSLGSGTIIDSRGYIVTNDHVVTGAKSLQVEIFDGALLPAKMVGVDPLDDLAVIKITPPPHMVVAKLGNSSDLQVGQTVLAIGNPLGITQTVTGGIVSALNRNVSEGEGGGVIFNAIQMDAPINPGNSGGALVDLRGDLIGIPTLTIVNPSFNAPASGVGFSIPANRAAFIVPQLIQSGKVTNIGLADLGLSGTSVDATVAARLQLPVTQGVLIASVDSNGPAARAGLQAGDMIVRINDTPVTNESTLLDNVLNRSPGEKVTLQIYRGSQRSTVNVTLGKLQIATV